MPIRNLVAGCVLVCAMLVSYALEPTPAYKAGAITVVAPHARSTAPGQPNGGGYLSITNRGGDDRLLSVSAAVAGAVELHSMKMEGDVMRMRQVEAIALPAGKTVELAPGGLHIMFLGLKAPLKAGESFPLKLRFERAGELTVNVKVEAPGAGPQTGHSP